MRTECIELESRLRHNETPFLIKSAKFVPFIIEQGKQEKDYKNTIYK